MNNKPESYNELPQTAQHKNYLKKNLEQIKKIQEKNQQKQTDLELQKEKKLLERELLKKEILEEVVKTLENRPKRQKSIEITEEVSSATSFPKKPNIFRIKKQTSNQDFPLDRPRTISSTKDLKNPDENEDSSLPSNNQENIFKYDKEKMMRIYENKLSVMKKKETNEENKEIIEEDQVEKQKLRNYFRSRYASFINSLKYDFKLKKLNEDNEKKRKETMLNKIREDMGLNNISSKIMEPTNAFKAKQVNRDEHPLKRSLSETNEMKEEKEILIKENQRKLLHKQKETLTKLLEKQAQKKMKDDEKTEKETKIKEKLKKHILKTLNTSSKALEPIVEKPSKKKSSPFTITDSANLNGLNLEGSNLSQTHKITRNTSLKPLLRKATANNQEDEDLLKIAHLVTPIVTKGKKKKKKNKAGLKMYPFITDLAEWRKKQRLDPETKVFIILGGYSDLKHSFIQRGWVENPDPNSFCFDVKWTLFAKDIIYEKLQDFQIVNHFERNTSITTKVGLCKNLRNLIWFNNVDIDAFYPMCFDLGDVNDYEDFIQEFKCSKAESILKIYQNMLSIKSPKIKEYELKAKVALDVCERRVRDFDDYIDEKNSELMVSENEWEILSSDELGLSELAKKKHENWLKKLEQKYNKPTTTSSETKEKKAKKKKKTKKKKDSSEKAEKTQEDVKEDNEEDDFGKKIDKCMAVLQEKFPQFSINGTKNIWIVKPAGLSRGRGIAAYNNLVEILDYVDSKESQWVVQKYIENPLLMKQRKFDIRQWVLVTDWNPLVIWIYEECYIRFSPENYNTDDLSNKFIHLTNNSIAKYSTKFDNSEIVGNMWTCDDFNKDLKEKEGYDVFYEKIKPKIREIVKWSLESVQDMVENRKSSHELYGYDFMVDDQYNTWLIEINSSPAMDYSTPVTERLVKMVMNDLPKVIIDYNLTKKKRKGIDTGLFKCIHKGNIVPDKPLTSFGLNLMLEGKAIKK